MGYKSSGSLQGFTRHVQGATFKAAKDLAEAGVEDLADRWRENVPQKTGDLKASIHATAVHPFSDAGGVGYRGAAESSDPAARFIEHGTRDHEPARTKALKLPAGHYAANVKGIDPQKPLARAAAQAEAQLAKALRPELEKWRRDGEAYRP